MPITGRAVEIETFLAPALDRRMLVEVSRENGKVLGRIVAIQVRQGEPPDEIFRVPRDAKVVTPLAFGKANREARGLPRCDSCEAAEEVVRRTTNQLPPVF